MSKSILKENDLTISYIKKQYDIIDQKAIKLQIDNTKKDKEIQSLQSELLIFKKSTNNTSSQFPLPSEFKKQWLNLVQASLMDCFDTIYSNSLLLSIVVQKSFMIIYTQAKEVLHEKIIFILNCFGITEHNEETLQIFFVKFRKIIFQDYYKTLFNCNDIFIHKTIQLIKNSLNEECCSIGDYTFNHKDKEDVMKDLNASVTMKKYVEEAFWLCLFMILHDPPLMLNHNEGAMYYYFSKSDFINIEGFAKDNSPCLLILYPPMIRANMVFNGIKATVYACETVTKEIMKQCDLNKQNPFMKKKTVKSLSDGEEKYSSNISFNKTGPDQLSQINYYKTIEELNQCSSISNNNQKDNNNMHQLQQEEIIKTNKMTETNGNDNESTKHKTNNTDNLNLSSSNVNQLKQNNHHQKKNNNANNSNHNQTSSFELNEPIIQKQNTAITTTTTNNNNNPTKIITSYNNNLNAHNNSNTTTIRSNSVNKPHTNSITKHIQKALMYNIKKKNDDRINFPSNNTNSNSILNNPQAQVQQRNSLKETLLQNSITNKLININDKEKEKERLLTDAKQSSSIKSKQHIKQSHTKSTSPNHIIDKSRNSNHMEKSSISQLNKFEILTANDQPLITETRPKTNITAANYLRTPIPKGHNITTTKENNNDQLSSSRRDTSNIDSSEPIRYNTNMTSVYGYHHTKGQDDLNNLNYCKNSHYQTTIKRVSSGNSYLRKIISDTNTNYRINHDSSKNDTYNTNDNIRNDSFAESKIGDKNHYNHSSSNPYLLRNNLQPEDSHNNNNGEYTINRDSSSNTLLTNNSNNQSNYNQCIPLKGNRNEQKNNHFLTANSNNESRSSITHNNINNANDNSSKLEYNTNTINSKQSANKNNPTISFNLGKGVNYMINPIMKTENNNSSINNSIIQTNNTIKAGLNSSRTAGNNNNNIIITGNTNLNGTNVSNGTTNDFKFNGLRRNDNIIQKKGSLGSNSNNGGNNSNKKKLDVQLNYDLTANQFQALNMNSPSFRMEKDKGKIVNPIPLTSYKNNSNKAVVTNPVTSNLLCNDNSFNNNYNPKEKTLTKTGTFDHSGGIVNHFANSGNINSNAKQRKYNNISNKILNQLGVKAETYLGLKK